MNNIAYLLSNTTSVIVTYIYMNIFFTTSNISKIRQIIGYSLYYLIVSGVYIIAKNPMLSLITSIITIFMLTTMYKGGLGKKVLVTTLIYVIFLVVDSTLYNTLKDTISNEYGELTLIINLALSIIGIFLLKNKKNYTQDIKTQFNYMFIIVAIGSMVILNIGFYEKISKVNMVIISIIQLLIIIIIYHANNILIISYKNAIKNKFLETQNKAYKNQIKLIKQNENNIRTIKHDMKNYIHHIKELKDLGEYSKMDAYFHSILGKIEKNNNYIKTGNTAIDSIVNYKLTIANKKGIKIQTSSKIDKKINIKEIDINTIFGNLLDNAIEASKKVDNKHITVNIVSEFGLTYISVKNNYNGHLQYENRKLISTKKNKDEHGYGLKSIENVVKEYNGKIQYNSDDKIFETSIMLYEKKSDET